LSIRIAVVLTVSALPGASAEKQFTVVVPWPDTVTGAEYSVSAGESSP
jgi:hypothetical protein